MSETSKISPSAVWIRRWLVLVGLMVYAMILIGGATRLTDSGLSITEWNPVSGALPPLSDAAWQTEFAKYRETAEYQLVNQGMSLAEFQKIFWWEWGHRFFGRMIGLVAVVGLAIFAIRGWLTRRLTWQLVALIGLGGLQGAIGWWMVASGIGETTRVDVAPYRLMTHFMLALLIIAYVAWLWLDLGTKPRGRVPDVARTVSLVLLVAIFLQMAAGALVAGLDAGRSYNDWPLMAGEFIPSHYLEEGLGLRSLFEGRAATQFNHRILAYLVWAGALASAWVFRATPLRQDFRWLGGLVTLQAAWGIFTLVHAAPMNLALIHQGLGVIVTLAAVRLVWRSRAV
ncbi:MAG: COX15/CtaA family protein [Hyphomonas sp.]|nr:COX15/CtaA family protein [Hyphomonas sp.]